MPLLGSLATPDFGKGFRKKAFQALPPPALGMYKAAKVAELSQSYSTSWLDIEIDLYANTVIKKNTSGTTISGYSFDSDITNYTLSSGQTYLWYLLHLPLCGSNNYYSADLQVDRVSIDNTLTNFKTFGDTTSGFSPHVSTLNWYNRYKGKALSGLNAFTVTDKKIVEDWSGQFRSSLSTYSVATGTSSHTVSGDVGGTGSSNTGLTTNRAGSTTGYYIYSEASGSTTQFNCKRAFVHQLPGLWTVGSGSTNRKWGVSLGMYGAHIGTVNIYVVRVS
jgi:hypothetical protein